MSEPVSSFQNAGGRWSAGVYQALKAGGIELVPFVPDGGLRGLIEHCQADPDMQAITLSTEEEGIALAAGAWLGGKRSVMLMQSSGVGNTVNMLSLLKTGQFPLLMLVTMRGEWGEFNPWQVPMGQATPKVLEAMGVLVQRCTEPDELPGTVEAALRLAYSTYSPVAVLISQQLLGSKAFGVQP
ncbi:phosphonopyruvate decarboxylase [Deinococcus sp. KSM4-11]|uniref:thiamine pyrophosphate-binding protein n=1 Tax=Deinococcus sp. KSM4-11 TaxID=2568654 RepID=UPI0010A541E5|nr:thiamine pyrophosphate-binding protein [Deinococcus sp. KSM4-11]THF85446.1 phosphonopyruvate decarboxylase [Deinococcus sp. KSM4-11]